MRLVEKVKNGETQPLRADDGWHCLQITRWSEGLPTFQEKKVLPFLKKKTTAVDEWREQITGNFEDFQN